MPPIPPGTELNEPPAWPFWLFVGIIAAAIAILHRW